MNVWIPEEMGILAPTGVLAGWAKMGYARWSFYLCMVTIGKTRLPRAQFPVYTNMAFRASSKFSIKVLGRRHFDPTIVIP